MIVTRADRKKANSGETMESNIDTQANPLRLESESNGQGEASVAARGEQWYALQVRPRFEKVSAGFASAASVLGGGSHVGTC